MADLKLGRLPARTPVKITINVSPDLNQALGLYAELYRETYGETEAVQELIPAMLARFLEGDRAFVQRQRKGGRRDATENPNRARRADQHQEPRGGPPHRP